MCLSIISFIVIFLLFDKQPVVVVAIKYEPNWSSLDKRPLPLWYDEAKVGIFIHWGIYTVPSMGTEWFWTNWQNQKLENYVEFMKKNYKPNYTYQDFAHDFTAELFNATQWAELFKDAGARYVVFVSKHHDGYCLWPSAYSFGWNSMDVGPKRDILGELSVALRKNTKLKFGVYYSLFEWFNRLYLNDKLHGFRKQDYVNLKMHPEQRQLIEEYQPDIIWSDGDWEASDIYWKSTKFLAWLYNDSPVRGTVVVNDRWGNGTACRHGGFYNCHDRYNPHHLLEHKWENCLTLDTQSWGQRFDVTLNNFLTPEELIRQVVTTISCNGNVLVNVAPTKYGIIMPIFEERLRQMGEWLRINADAIYATKPWVIQNDTLQPDVWYTSRIDKNREADNILNIYAIVLKYPYDSNAITLKPWSHLIEDPRVTLFGIEQRLMNLNDKIISVVMLGMPDTTIKWQVKNSSLYITFPPKRHIDRSGLKYAWTFQIVMDTK